MPDKPALLWQDRSITYAQLDERVTAGAGALQHLGIEAGDRVALMVGNTPAFVEAHFATLRAGGVVVPLNTGLTSTEVEHILRDSGAEVAVVTAPIASVVLRLVHQVPTLRHVVVVAGSNTPAPDGATGTWKQLREAGHAFSAVERSSDDLAALVYTSGTTGDPKGAMLTRANLAANQDQSLAGRFRIEQDDVVLLVLPLFHIYALNVGLGASIRVGATMLLVERFDPTSTIQEVVDHGVTIILGAPPMYVAWANTPGIEDVDLSRVRMAVSGAAPLPPQVLGRFQHQFGLPIWEGYGLTEAAPSVASNAMGEEPKPGSVGLPLPDLEIRLVGKDGDDVELGDPGEVWVRGPNVFQGYWNNDEATAEALTSDGWLRTGDIATQDDDGYLYLVDRRKDLIIVSGFNVYPREVERVIYRHPGVAECAVVGVPHPYTGEAVKAFIVPVAGEEVSEDEIAIYCRDSLARYKCPESVEIVTELPHTATGKVRRGELRAGAEA